MMKFSSEQSPLSKKNTLKNTNTSFGEQIHGRFCTNCNSPLEDDDLFCSECGCKIEQEESAIIIEDDEEVKEQTPVFISPDRMASILQTNRMKEGIIEDDFRNVHPFNDIVVKAIQTKNAIEKKSSLLGHYVHRDKYMTQYFIIESIQGNCVKALVKTLFDNGSYSTEFYEGTLSDGNLHLQIVDSDLHPLPDELQFFFGTMQMVHHSIKLSENFVGIVREDAILGSFSGQFSKAVVFRKC